MDKDEIKKIARMRGMNPGRLKKVDLIRTMQRDEDNESSFQTGQTDGCDQGQCLWHGDCLK